MIYITLGLNKIDFSKPFVNTNNLHLEIISDATKKVKLLKLQKTEENNRFLSVQFECVGITTEDLINSKIQLNNGLYTSRLLNIAGEEKEEIKKLIIERVNEKDNRVGYDQEKKKYTYEQ